MKQIPGLRRGMGIGGWLTNYKRFNVLPREYRLKITDGDLEHFATYITERDVAYIASLGMDHIRLGFDQLVLEAEPFRYREEILSLLRDFVGWCRKYSLRPVLNMHKAIGNYCDIPEECGLMEDPVLQERFIAVWTMLEDAFSHVPEVIFELLNEVAQASAEDWNRVAEACIRAIRAKNPHRLLVVGGVDWNTPPALDHLKVYEDENILYTFHCYAPHEFTHQQGVLQWGPLYYNRKMEWPSDDVERYREYHRLHGQPDPYEGLTRMDREYLRAYMAPVQRFLKNHPDKVLWCGEFGTIRHCNLRYRENWMRDMIALLNQWDVPYCVWNYLSTPNDGNRFSLVDDDDRRILSEELSRILRGETES